MEDQATGTRQDLMLRYDTAECGRSFRLAAATAAAMRIATSLQLDRLDEFGVTEKAITLLERMAGLDGEETTEMRRFIRRVISVAGVTAPILVRLAPALW